MDYALYQHDQALQGQDSRISTLEDADKVTSFKGRTGAVVPANDDYTIAQIKATGTAGQVPTLNSQGKLEMADVPESGHEIVNPSGTSMPQRSKLKVMGSVSVSDDSANDQTVINVTGGGGGGSGHTIQNPSGSSMTQRTNLQFTGTGVTVTDNSTDDKTVVKIDGGSGSGGHTIENASGDELTQRDVMQVTDGLEAVDDSTNQKTKIKMNLPTISLADWNAMTEQEQEAYKASHYRFGVEQPDTSGVINAEYMKLLWENPNTTQAFAPQTITLNSADYDFLLWVYRGATTGAEEAVIVPKRATANLTFTNAGSSTVNRTRTASRTDDTHYAVSDCYTNSTTTNNGYTIPIAVYGIKKNFQFKVNAIATDLSTSADHCFLSDDVTSVEDAITYKDVYSTDEHIVGKWIDGSVLYEKTVDCGAFPNATTKNVAHNITNLDKVVFMGGFGYSGTNSYPLPFVQVSGTTVQAIRLNTSATYIQIMASYNASSVPNSYVTLRYTKTS
jgi:hypothetical protein